MSDLISKKAPSSRGQENGLISRQAAIDALDKRFDNAPMEQTTEILLLRKDLRELPSAQPETCEGCKHLGNWENEVEYGYPSPCTNCKRRVGDHYER